MAEGYEPVKTPYFAAPRRWEAIDRMLKELFNSRGESILTITDTEFTADAIGEIAQLRSSASGGVYSKVSGPDNVTISPDGTVSVTSGVALNEAVTFVARVQGANGFAIEKRFTLIASIAAETPTPTLELGGPLSFTAGTEPGTIVATIGNVPAGATPALTPNDGRLTVAGNAVNGWKVVTGLTAATAGKIALSVSAEGANGASADITVLAASIPEPDDKVVARPAPATTPPNFTNLTTGDTGDEDTGSLSQFIEFQPQNVGFEAFFRIGASGTPLSLGIGNQTNLGLFGVPGNQYQIIGGSIEVADVANPDNGKIRASFLPNGDFEVLQNGVRRKLIPKETIIAANPEGYNPDRTGIRFRSNAEFAAVSGGAYAILYNPLTFVSASYDSLGFVEVVADYYMPLDDFIGIEILSGDGTTVLVAKVNAEIVGYPQPGRVRLRSKTPLPANRRGFPTRIRIAQAASGEAATQNGVVWAAAPSFGVNPNAAIYYYGNAPTANKNAAEWRYAVNAGNENGSPVLDTTGTPVAAEFADGKRPSMYLGMPAISGQRTRVQITGEMTGLRLVNNGNGASATNVSPVTSANGESWVDFNWNWDQLRYVKGEWQNPGQGSFDIFLMNICPQGTTPYSNCRIFEINDDGSRRSPGYWDIDHIAANSRYSKFLFPLRFMDMMNTVGTAGNPNVRITQAGDVGQQITHSVPDMLDLLTATGTTGRFHIPLQASEAWVRTESRRTAKWAKQYNKQVMWTLANEIWNSGQPAWHIIGDDGGLAQQAIAANLYPDSGGSRHDKVLRYQSYRHKQVMVWVMEEFVAEQVEHLLICNVDLHNDAVAIAPQVCEAEPGIAPYIQSISVAPYIGGGKGIGLAANDISTVDTRIRNDIPIVYGRAAANRDYATSRGWAFFEYEGGFEDLVNGPLWHNLMASQEGYDLLKYMIAEHQRIVGGQQTFYTDYRQSAFGLTHHVSHTATFPPEWPSMFAKAWYEAMAAA